MSVIADVVYNGHVEGLKDLLAAGVNPNEANYPVPLWGLVWSDKKENDIGDSIAKILLEAKLDPNGFIDAGRTQSAFADALRAPSPSFVIQAFIKAKVKVNDLVWDGEHYDPLLDAIARNDLEVVRMVLQAGYNTKGIAAKLNSGAEINAFEYAIAAKNVEVVKELLKKKPDVNRKIKRDDGEMTSPLCIAVAQDDNSEIVTLLLKSGAKVNQMCSDGSPLLAAVKKQDVESVRALVKAKANVNETINSEGTKLAILDFAQYLGNDEIVDILKKAGATVPFRGSFVDYCLNANITEKMVLDAIKDGADVNETESEQGWTPLHAIAQNGKDPKAMAVLIKRGAIVNAMTRTGFTPFLSAAKNNPNPAFLKMLIAAGADIDAKTSEGFGALQIAIAYNSPAVVSLLLNTSLGNNLSNRSKNILVIDAVRINPDPKVLIALFKAGFKAEPEESWLDKPLHAALESKRSLEVIKILLQGKAVVDDRAMRLARDLPMGSAEENKYRNTVIDMLTKAKKKQR
jgi:ankyrin repeat protein